MIESFSDLDILLYCPSAAVVLGTWAEHKLDGNAVWVWGPCCAPPPYEKFSWFLSAGL